MTASGHPRVVSSSTATSHGALSHAQPALADLNRVLNERYAMARLRARGGRIVRWIEERRRKLVADRVLGGSHRRVLDVGSEDGWIAEAFAHDVETLVLLDIDPAPLAQARLRLGASVRTVEGDASDPSFLERAIRPGSFDVVVASAMLEHLPDPDTALAGLARCLEPGGRIVAYVPADGPILLAKGILRRTRAGFLVKGLSLAPAPGHLRRFDRASLSRLLRRHGRVQEIVFDPGVLGYVGVVCVGGTP